MAGAVFPERMDKLDPANPQESLRTVEAYIGYMQERIEFSVRNTTRAAQTTGVTNAAMLMMLTTINNSLSALSATVNQLTGTVNGLGSRVRAVEEDIEKLGSQVQTMEEDIGKLKEAVAALEGAQGPE
ncbi:MAG: hypothetical protein MR419_09570 [Clostridiales bacterium]|nr:hypothetical protein [Clostridiales bacterium]MDY4173264.1 hypothetical protein [Evtepia sp.]